MDDATEAGADGAAALPLCRAPFAPLPWAYTRAVAPMVNQSDLAFRLLCRRHGADVAYTQMFLADDFAASAAYRASVLQTCPEDRPLVVQLAGHNVDAMVSAALLAQPHCDAVDLNLGCPQERAQAGHYGAYLLERRDWPLVAAMVSGMARALSIPVFCKIRLLASVDATIEFARLLQAAGCRLLVVHGRQRGSERRRRAGPAHMAAIARIKAALSIPVIANGNLRCHADVHANLVATGADGVMSAEGLLADPALFECERSRRREPAPRASAAALAGQASCTGSTPLQAGDSLSADCCGAAAADHTSTTMGGHVNTFAASESSCPRLAAEGSAARCPAPAAGPQESLRSVRVAAPAAALALIGEYLELCAQHPTRLADVQQHVGYMLGKTGRGAGVRYRYAGPYSGPQLRALLSSPCVDAVAVSSPCADAVADGAALAGLQALVQRVMADPYAWYRARRAAGGTAAGDGSTSSDGDDSGVKRTTASGRAAGGAARAAPRAAGEGVGGNKAGNNVTSAAGQGRAGGVTSVALAWPNWRRWSLAARLGGALAVLLTALWAAVGRERGWLAATGMGGASP